MNIGFDAKRAFHNRTGLGHYSRSLISALAEYYPHHDYFLFNTRPSDLFPINKKNLHEVLPHSVPYKLFPALWRSSGMTADFKKRKLDIYHGLSHELPLYINTSGVRSVVTIHDLIHERFPEQYSKVDVQIYRRKFRYACRQADKIIAISHQTRRDIIEFYGIPEEKITVCYQSCHPAFAEQVSDEVKEKIKKKYQLPEQYFLYVGSVIERKNLLTICRAMVHLGNELSVPLVVIGDGGKYKQQVKEFIRRNGLDNRVFFLSEHPLANRSSSFLQPEDFPAIYQLAVALIYPSYYEGFGIPVLEALWSRLPVITSNVSCLPETGGNGVYYVNPASAGEIAEGMKKIYFDKTVAESLKEKGWQQAHRFTAQQSAASVMNVYEELYSG
jgi:glycosyltransferase involved in cell wall biosynthesis